MRARSIQGVVYKLLEAAHRPGFRVAQRRQELHAEEKEITKWCHLSVHYKLGEQAGKRQVTIPETFIYLKIFPTNQATVSVFLWIKMITLQLIDRLWEKDVSM